MSPEQRLANLEIEKRNQSETISELRKENKILADDLRKMQSEKIVRDYVFKDHNEQVRKLHREIESLKNVVRAVKSILNLA